MQARVFDSTVTTVDVEERRVERNGTETEEDQETAASQRAASARSAALPAALPAAARLHARAVQLLRKSRECLASGTVHGEV
jgi:hypothetical protein